MISSWFGYVSSPNSAATFAMKRASQRDQIYPVFRELFRKESN